MALARVWPDDWTGHALQRILTLYRWIANCGKAKAVQVRILINFINHVLAENATNGRHLKPPLTYQKIKEAMANRIGSKGINSEACQTGREPYSSTQDGARIQKNDGYTGANTTYTHPSTGAGPSNNGRNRGKGSNPPQKGSRTSKPEFCRGFNSAAGCNFTATTCRHKHACSRTCNKTDHSTDTHT